MASGNKPRVVIVSGLSGAGKTWALKALEDIGFFCVDNLPLPLLEGFLEFCRSSGDELSRVAVGMDIRGRVDLADCPEAYARLRDEGYPLEVLFLEADEKALFARYRETRRPHPLAVDGSVLDTIRREHQALAGVRASADSVIDTSSLSIHELRRRLVLQFEPAEAEGPIRVTLLSFGYRHGVPFEADLIFDVRFLPNPHFVPDLRALDGRNESVAKYVFSHELTKDFFTRLNDFLVFLLPQYQKEGKTYLTIGIGCTGGQHRSVAIVEELKSSLSRQGVMLEARHRELAT